LKKEIDASGSGTFAGYSKSFTVGPYWRTEIAKRLVFGIELDLSPISYDSDPTNLSSQRTGTEKSLIFSLAQAADGSKWWNPSGDLKLSDNGTKGTEFKAYALTLDFYDRIHLAPKLDLLGTFSYSFTRYPVREPESRTDHQYFLQAAATWTLNPRWSVVSSLEGQSNISTLSSTYSYSRIAASFGATYSF